MYLHQLKLRPGEFAEIDGAVYQLGLATDKFMDPGSQVNIHTRITFTQLASDRWKRVARLKDLQPGDRVRITGQVFEFRATGLLHPIFTVTPKENEYYEIVRT